MTEDLSYATTHVRKYDPAGFLPGQLLPPPTTTANGNSDDDKAAPRTIMKTAYYAVRHFRIETGLRFGATAHVAPHSSPAVHLEWWQQGIDRLFDGNDNYADFAQSKDFNHPALRLLQSLLRYEMVPWEQSSFDGILQGRRIDVDVKQYDTMDDLVRHAEQSCSHLNKLILQSGRVDESTNPKAYEAARLVGIGHGLTNALRTSIPVVSTTGKLVIPTELTQKYGVKTPRYLLSALGQGDVKCAEALQMAVRDIAATARDHLRGARALRTHILAEPDHQRSLPVLLPSLASETFLDRLAAKTTN